jgi:hypothetical protein
MSTATTHARYTFAEYLELEEHANVRHDFRWGAPRRCLEGTDRDLPGAQGTRARSSPASRLPCRHATTVMVCGPTAKYTKYGKRRTTARRKPR